jgi:hypothetical protein
LYAVSLDDDFIRQKFQFSSLTGLPLMSCEMSRTSAVQAKSFFDLLRGDLSVELKSQLREEPVLILVNENKLFFYRDYEFPYPG